METNAVQEYTIPELSKGAVAFLNRMYDSQLPRDLLKPKPLPIMVTTPTPTPTPTPTRSRMSMGMALGNARGFSFSSTTSSIFNTLTPTRASRTKTPTPSLISTPAASIRSNPIASIKSAYSSSTTLPLTIAAAAPELSKPLLILINGYPGIGKNTIARALQACLPKGTRFISSHTWMDAVYAVEPVRDENGEWYTLRNSMRDQMFLGINAIQDKTVSIIMTNCITEQRGGDVKAFVETLGIAKTRNMSFVMVTLGCEWEEHTVRLEGREIGGTTGGPRVTSTDELEQLQKDFKLLNTDFDSVRKMVRDIKFSHLRLDTTDRSEEESVEAVLAYLTAL